MNAPTPSAPSVNTAHNSKPRLLHSDLKRFRSIERAARSLMKSIDDTGLTNDQADKLRDALAQLKAA
jgi:hypothetical protein